MVPPFIPTRYSPPGRRIRTPSGPAVHLHSLSAARKAYEEPEGSTRLSSLDIRRPEGVSGPRVVQPFIFTRYPLPGRPIRTASCPGVYRHSLFVARQAYPDPELSSGSSSLPIRRREGVSRLHVVQAFIFTRYPPPGRRMRNPRGLRVYLHSLSVARKAYPDSEWSRRSSSLGIHRQEGVLAVRQLYSRLSPIAIRRRKDLFGP